MISVTIVALNEADRIADCIRSVRDFTDDIVVVDSLSSDETRTIAESLGARVVEQAYLGGGPQRNYAATLARHDWIFSLDADERATPELATLLAETDFSAATFEGYSFRRRTYVGDRWIRYGGWYPDRVVRLYDRQRLSFVEKPFHASIVGGRIRPVDSDILHYSFANIGQLIYGQRYGIRDALGLYREGKRVGALAPAGHGLWAFLRTYVLRRGFLGGMDGLSVAISAGLNTYMKYAILNELVRDPSAVAFYENIHR